VFLCELVVEWGEKRDVRFSTKIPPAEESSSDASQPFEY